MFTIAEWSRRLVFVFVSFFLFFLFYENHTGKLLYFTLFSETEKKKHYSLEIEIHHLYVIYV